MTDIPQGYIPLAAALIDARAIGVEVALKYEDAMEHLEIEGDGSDEEMLATELLRRDLIRRRILNAELDLEFV